MKKIGRPRSCECGTCHKCLRREYMLQWYRGKTLAERRAMIAGRDPRATRRAERNRYAKRKGTLVCVCNYTFNNAVRDGLLTRDPREVCGTAENIHGHHDDYSRPLDVRWLCRLHHMLLHGQLRLDTAAAS